MTGLDWAPPTLPQRVTSPMPWAQEPQEILGFDVEGRLLPFPGVRHPLRSLVWLVRGLFGLASLTVLLALISAIPLVNFLALGYLLEVEGRVGRSGRLREAFPLLGLAPRIGSIALGCWLWLLPLRLIAAQADAAHIIAPGSPQDARMRTLLTIASVSIGMHLCLALARGGSPGCFLRPVKNARWLWGRMRAGEYFDQASLEIVRFWQRLRVRRHFSLGARGFAAAGTWLAIPTLIYASVRDPGGRGGLQMFLGGMLLAWVFAWMPFLQARFSAENRWRAAFELREVRELFRHAPFTWLLALVATYVLALPLYLFKAFALPQDALWPITLVFVASIYPTKLTTGWAYARAVRRQRAGKRSHFLVRSAVRTLGVFPLLAVYVFILYFTQFLGVHGKLTLIENHVFLLPWPYLIGMDG
jgi:hypothetical protein